jgi:hypothetical protein
MNKYAFVVEIVSEARWFIEAETLAKAKRKFRELGEEGERPDEEDVIEEEVVAVFENGVRVPSPGEKP